MLLRDDARRKLDEATAALEEARYRARAAEREADAAERVLARLRCDGHGDPAGLLRQQATVQQRYERLQQALTAARQAERLHERCLLELRHVEREAATRHDGHRAWRPRWVDLLYWPSMPRTRMA